MARAVLTTLGVAFLVGTSPPVVAGGVTQLAFSSEVVSSALPTVRAWLMAIEAQSVAKLTSLALPEEQQWVARALGDKTSFMYRALFVGSRSIAAQLATVRGEGTFFRHDDIPNPYVTVCWSEEPAGRSWPAQSSDLYGLGAHDGVYCHDFIGDQDGGWNASFSFAKDPED